jgi:hypothetical protein
MDARISICTVAKSAIQRSSHLIPSVKFSPTNSLEDEGKLFIHSNRLEQVHIVYVSVTKLSLVERLILLHHIGATRELVTADVVSLMHRVNFAEIFSAALGSLSGVMASFLGALFRG